MIFADGSEYSRRICYWLGGGDVAPEPESIKEAFMYFGAVLVLRNQKLFHLQKQLPSLRSGEGLRIPVGLDLGSLG